MRLFSPRKTTMLFVIRDKTRVHSLLFSLSLLLLYHYCFVDVILDADATGELRACPKRRYSEGKQISEFQLIPN